ncbi:hypothetical protein ACOSQ3_013464 [Xanthoceras sorbifolium]
MSNSGDQRRHKVNTNGPSNTRDRRSRLSDDVLDGRSAATHRGEVTGLLLQVVQRLKVIRGSSLRSLPQGIMAGVRRLYIESRGWTIIP